MGGAGGKKLHKRSLSTVEVVEVEEVEDTGCRTPGLVQIAEGQEVPGLMKYAAWPPLHHFQRTHFCVNFFS